MARDAYPYQRAVSAPDTAYTKDALYRDVLSELGIYSPEQQLQDTDRTHLASGLRRLLNDWSSENLLQPARLRYEQELPGGKNVYTIGLSDTNDIQIAPPTKITQLAFKHGWAEKRLLRWVGTDPSIPYDYARINDAEFTYYQNSYIPDTYAYFRGWPTAAIKIDSSSAGIVTITGDGYLPEIPDDADIFNYYPPYYQNALIYGLADKMQNTYGVNNPMLRVKMRKSYTAIRNQHFQSSLIEPDPGCQGSRQNMRHNIWGFGSFGSGASQPSASGTSERNATPIAVHYGTTTITNGQPDIGHLSSFSQITVNVGGHATFDISDPPGAGEHVPIIFVPDGYIISSIEVASINFLDNFNDQVISGRRVYWTTSHFKQGVTVTVKITVVAE